MGNKKREKREEDEEGSQTAPVSKKARQEGLEQPAEASESYPESPGHNGKHFGSYNNEIIITSFVFSQTLHSHSERRLNSYSSW